MDAFIGRVRGGAAEAAWQNVEREEGAPTHASARTRVVFVQSAVFGIRRLSVP